MKEARLIITALGCCIAIVAFTIEREPASTIGVDPTLQFIKIHISQFANSTTELEAAIKKIKKNDPHSKSNAIEALKKCRMKYKNIEFFLTYFFRSNAHVFNAQPNFEVENPYFEYEAPTGLQVIESILFSKNAASQKEDLEKQADLVNSSAADIYSFLYYMKISDKQILESVRLGLIRLIALGITGYDAPELKTGISESAQALITFKIILAPFLSEKYKEADSVLFYLDASLKLFQRNNNFDSFDRLHFLTNAALPLQFHLGLLIKEEGLELNSTGGLLNYNAKDLFSPDALDINPDANPFNLPIFPTDSQLTRLNTDSTVISLGKKLFFETALSGNTIRSCASCHQPVKYFTDGLPKALAPNAISAGQRNTPTLFYVEDQYSQFWDGRAKNLEEQIMDAIKDSNELDADYTVVVKRLQGNKKYIALFNKVFVKEKGSSINIGNIAFSIATFEKTLSPINSPFDRYMEGDRRALNKYQISGFNLFTGKALCATCHTVPLFNGLLPPFYDMTELENLGVTKDTDFTHPRLDTDSGRFATTPAKYYLRKFKIPTLRNIAKTAPYMHNGAFPNLETVLEFYNKGGSEGLGLDVPDQTLSPKPLQLSHREMDDIIAFLNSLTDTDSSILRPSDKSILLKE